MHHTANSATSTLIAESLSAVSTKCHTTCLTGRDRIADRYKHPVIEPG